MRYFDGTYLPWVKPLDAHLIKKIDVQVSVEYQKNALRCLLMRFKACLGIKPLASYQTSKKKPHSSTRRAKTPLKATHDIMQTAPLPWQCSTQSESCTSLFTQLYHFPLMAQRNCFPFSLVARWRTRAFSQCPFLSENMSNDLLCYVLLMRKAKNSEYPCPYIY